MTLARRVIGLLYAPFLPSHRRQDLFEDGLHGEVRRFVDGRAGVDGVLTDGLIATTSYKISYVKFTDGNVIKHRRDDNGAGPAS